MTTPTPSVAKNSADTRMISSCSVEPGSPTGSARFMKMDRLDSAGMLPRRSK